MKNDKDKSTGMVQDVVSGYGAVVLGVACFLLALVVIMAIVRFAVGMGASA